MKILDLVNKLKVIYDQHGDVEVMFTDPNSNNGPFEVFCVNLKTVISDNEFPEDFNMPKGFKFVHLTN